MENNTLKAILVDVVPHGTSTIKAQTNLDELNSLVNTLGGITIKKVIQKRGRPSAKTFLGSGKTQEVAEFVKILHTNVVIFNNILKPNQVLHLTAILKTKVWDRVDLILKIFEKHATTRESKLQINLAKLYHEFPKLYGKGYAIGEYGRGVAFSQQTGGGAGKTGVRGPGEKYLEQRKRHLRRQIKISEDQLEVIKRQRKSQREVRKRKNLKTIAIVGYTNSGKSTLLKALTGKKEVYIADELFATLDTKIGDMYLQQYGTVLVADTIGFIKDLPPFLIKSFLATLEEVKEADLILHVIDISDPRVLEKIKVVEKILEELGCGEKPRINVLNKIDEVHRKRFRKLPGNSIAISALKKQGVGDLIEKIKNYLRKM
ncbi:MAG: GTPase HflX [Candidatus Gracilibacteria bacterium]